MKKTYTRPVLRSVEVTLGVFGSYGGDGDGGPDGGGRHGGRRGWWWWWGWGR
ncbi:MAG: putative RiPP precursor [Candidatus Krumholzibacteriia bacterium]